MDKKIIEENENVKKMDVVEKESKLNAAECWEESN